MWFKPTPTMLCLIARKHGHNIWATVSVPNMYGTWDIVACMSQPFIFFEIWTRRRYGVTWPMAKKIKKEEDLKCTILTLISSPYSSSSSCGKQLVEANPEAKWGWMSHLSIPIPKSLDTCSDIRSVLPHEGCYIHSSLITP